MVKDSLNLKIPIERIKVSYDFNGSLTINASDIIEVNPIFRDSRNHIKLRWYYGIRRVAEKERPSGFSVISQWEDYNLQMYLAEHKDLDWIEKLSIASGIANALNYCHKKDILHYDIRTFEIQHHELPYGEFSPEKITKKILKGEYPPQKPVQRTPTEFQSIIERAWTQEPEKRPNIEKLYNSLDKLDFRNLLNQDVDLISYNKVEVEKVPGIERRKDKQYKAWKVFEEYESKSNDIDGKFWVGYYYLKEWYESAKAIMNYGVAAMISKGVWD
ncbi:hypothetical protein C1645_819447 [Glomus cerebriforme]|uniref:Serine-threonine/tyrosine-protein kinase catalytic domain-containing protein n=1 Tax=Glomus cerebriforme TaxID=658196 RepID=A0A397TEH8_9GLOM|nr:hypothetical protein C1645_819447 [Glomus cerebriforme]